MNRRGFFGLLVAPWLARFLPAPEPTKLEPTITERHLRAAYEAGMKWDIAVWRSMDGAPPVYVGGRATELPWNGANEL